MLRPAGATGPAVLAADWVTVAAPAQLQCQPSVPRAALLLQNISGRLQLNISLELLPPGLLQSPPAPQASRQPSAIPSAPAEYHGAANCAGSWSRQAPSLELCLSHYYASAHFALFTFLLFKGITLKCTSAGSTFAFLGLSIDISSNCLQLP